LAIETKKGNVQKMLPFL